MQTAEQEAFHKALTEQGQLLGRHQQVLSGVTQSLESLSQQQAEQQAQLAQLVTSVKDLTGQLQQMTLTDPAVSPVPSPAIVENSGACFPVSKPEKYEGDPDKLRGFLLQCSVFFENSPRSSDQARISFVVSRLAGKALEWATASWTDIQHLSYSQFVTQFRTVFDHPYEGKVSGELLCQLRQGKRSVVDYSLEFRTLAASSGWNAAELLVIFRQGLHPEILRELASKDDNLTLDQLITLAIKLEQLLHHRSRPRPSREYKTALLQGKTTTHHVLS